MTQISNFFDPVKDDVRVLLEAKSIIKSFLISSAILFTVLLIALFLIYSYPSTRASLIYFIWIGLITLFAIFNKENSSQFTSIASFLVGAK
ncbi:MAG: hypothetical protein ACRC26_10825, partial [Bacteroidales bacterium]